LIVKTKQKYRDSEVLMPKVDIAAFAAEVAGQIAVKFIHSICLILALIPTPFLLYYSIKLNLWDTIFTDWQFLFTAITLTTALCVVIYASARVMAWMLYTVVVPGVVWLLYAAVHGLAWLLRTIIVPGVVWLLCVALPVLARQLYAVVCGLARQLQNLGRSLKHGMAQRA
jgi:hypothetical protein